MKRWGGTYSAGCVRKSWYQSLDLFPSLDEMVARHLLSCVRQEELISSTGSVSVFVWKVGETPMKLCPLQRANLDRWICFRLHVKRWGGTNSVGSVRKVNVSHWICYSHQVIMWGGTCSVGTVWKANLNHWICFRPPVKRWELIDSVASEWRDNLNHSICSRPPVKRWECSYPVASD
jgi:hypothetical protein